jgi:hypothetical protein
LLTKKGQQFGISQFELFCFSSNCNGVFFTIKTFS